MIPLLKLFFLFSMIIILYNEFIVRSNKKDNTKNTFNKNSSNITGHSKEEYCQTEFKTHNIVTVRKEEDLNSVNDTTHKPRARHKRHAEGKDKSLYHYFENRDRLKKKYAKLFTDITDKVLINSCPDMVKLNDNHRLGEVLMDTIEKEVYELYEREREHLEDQFEVGKLPSILKKMNVEKGMALGDVPIFHKLLKYRYFKKFDEFSLDFFHYLPLVIKNQIRQYFMFTHKGGYDIVAHERILYLETRLDEWMLRCANHTRMGSIKQDAFYENEFLEEISPEIGNPHLLYEVTEMEDPNMEDAEKMNITMFVY